MIYNLTDSIGKALEYKTEEQIRTGTFIKAQVVPGSLDTSRIQADSKINPAAEFISENLQKSSAEGYEWLSVTTVISSEKPCCWVLSYEDFYTLEQYDSRNIECGAEEGFNFKKAEFTLEYKGKTYDKCRMLLIIHQPTDKGTGIELYCHMPKGYDGCVLGFHNSAALTQAQLELGMSDPAACLGLIERADGDLYIRIK